MMYFAAELHNRNLTYAEFARKRHEINSYYDEINRAEAEKRRAIALQLLGGMLLKNMNRPSPTPPLSVLEIIQKNQPCLSGYHPHPLYVVCTHFPE